MMESGISIEEISKWLGHSSVVTTDQIYIHYKNSWQEKSAQAIADIIPLK